MSDAVEPPYKKQKSDTSAIPVEPKYHHFHCDPTDDVVIHSSDGTFFRVSSYRLGKAR